MARVGEPSVSHLDISCEPALEASLRAGMARVGEPSVSHLDISCEPALLVKPLQETKPHTLYLSNIDQLFNYYWSLALFYAPSPARSSQHVASVLKRALQELLVTYPWAAGRLRVNQQKQRLEVDCNAQGVQFVSAASQLRFADLGDVSSVNPALDSLFVILKTPYHDPESPPLVALQVTRFSCGGFVLALTFNHVLLDGCGACTFLRNLCSLARSSGVCVPPDVFDRKQIMMPRNPPTPTFDHHFITTTKSDPLKSVTGRKFTFSEETIELLRLRALSQNGVAKCSRFVALAAHLWIAMAKTLEGLSPAEELPLRVPVNVRERFSHAIRNCYMGNAIYFAEPRATVQDLQVKPLAFAVVKIQEAVGRVTADYLQSLIDLVEVLGGKACLRPSALAIPSLAGFPFFDTDCGWGRPVYLGRPSKQLSNRILVLAGDSEGRSFNVLVVLSSEEEVARFEDAILVL